MADGFTGLTQLLKLNNLNALDVGAADIFTSAPALARMAATESSNGTKHIYLKYSTAPTVGFRGVNDGVENSISADTEVSIDLKILDAGFVEDVAIARAYKGGVEGFLAREAQRHIRKALAVAETQAFYGTGTPGSSSGFSGMANDSGLNGLSDTQVVNAGGTTAGTGSSCWVIRSVDALTDVAVVVKEGQLTIEPYYQTVMAGSTTGRLDVYRVPIVGHMGLQLGGSKSVVRVANLTADSGKGLTDALIAQALEKFPSDAPATMIVCNSRSLSQLQRSRTATNATGAPAPFPIDAFNIPIVVTDNIVSTETLLA
jgi:hypothetical protein